MAMEDKIEVTLHVIGISPFSNCRRFTLILVIYSRDVTHVIYARLHDEEWISQWLHSIFSYYVISRQLEIPTPHPKTPS